MEILIEGLNPNVVSTDDIVSYFIKMNNYDISKAINSAKEWGKRAIKKSSSNTEKVNQVIRLIQKKKIY